MKKNICLSTVFFCFLTSSLHSITPMEVEFPGNPTATRNQIELLKRKYVRHLNFVNSRCGFADRFDMYISAKQTLIASIYEINGGEDVESEKLLNQMYAILRPENIRCFESYRSLEYLNELDDNDIIFAILQKAYILFGDPEVELNLARYEAYKSMVIQFCGGLRLESIYALGPACVRIIKFFGWRENFIDRFQEYTYQDILKLEDSISIDHVEIMSPSRLLAYLSHYRQERLRVYRQMNLDFLQ